MTIRLTVLTTAALFLLGGCQDKPKASDVRAAPIRAAKPIAMLEGLPLDGNQGTALAAGFADCLAGPHDVVRCTRRDVSLLGVGPYTAAIDLSVPGNPPHFNQVTLWHDSDQGAILDIGEALKKDGWQSCLSGDFESYGRMGSPTLIVIDASYWGKRRAVISQTDKPFKAC